MLSYLTKFVVIRYSTNRKLTYQHILFLTSKWSYKHRLIITWYYKNKYCSRSRNVVTMIPLVFMDQFFSKGKKNGAGSTKVKVLGDALFWTIFSQSILVKSFSNTWIQPDFSPRTFEILSIVGRGWASCVPSRQLGIFVFNNNNKNFTHLPTLHSILITTLIGKHLLITYYVEINTMSIK